MSNYNYTESLTKPLSIDPTEITALHDYLTDRGIEHIFRRLYDGYQIIVGDEWDVICHGDSYGHDRGLLEIMGKYVYNTMDSVEGYLTAEEIIRRIETDEENKEDEEDEDETLIVYVVFYYDGYLDAWEVGNVYEDKEEAEKELAQYDNGYVMTRRVISK